MVMGASSSAGKTFLTALICRCLARRGVRVAPFKSQNISNNAMVCKDGSEIGRAQALQAFAARIAPHADMNPILIKPEGNGRSQIVVNGRSIPAMESCDYVNRREQLWPHVTAALDRLRTQYDVVVIEGAGSPAELNLADVEMVNMSVARYCDAPVLLVGDIERGGVFAQLLGTMMLLPAADRRRFRGLIVNKFRGDLSLFDKGVQILESRGGVPVLGVLPWIDDHGLPDEDAAALTCTMPVESDTLLDIAVVRLPHIANFDDFDPLKAEPAVRLRFVSTVEQLGSPTVVILPGTKNTIDDLHWLRECGLASRITSLAQHNTTIVGICGGYQMLGRTIQNPALLESDSSSCEGLNLLDIDTVLHPEKHTSLSRFRVTDDRICPGAKGAVFHGYEIHYGRSQTTSPWLEGAGDNSSQSAGNTDKAEGARSADGRIWGCYLHGLFANDRFRRQWLQHLGATLSDGPQTSLDASLDRAADIFEKHIDFCRVMETIGIPAGPQEHCHV